MQICRALRSCCVGCLGFAGALFPAPPRGLVMCAITGRSWVSSNRFSTQLLQRTKLATAAEPSLLLAFIVHWTSAMFAFTIAAGALKSFMGFGTILWGWSDPSVILAILIFFTAWVIIDSFLSILLFG